MRFVWWETGENERDERKPGDRLDRLEASHVRLMTEHEEFVREHEKFVAEQEREWERQQERWRQYELDRQEARVRGERLDDRIDKLVSGIGQFNPSIWRYGQRVVRQDED